MSCRLYSDEHEHWEINEEATEARWVKTTAAHLAVGDHAGLASAGSQVHATSEVKSEGWSRSWRPTPNGPHHRRSCLRQIDRIESNPSREAKTEKVGLTIRGHTN